MDSMNLTVKELLAFTNAQSEEEWNALCDQLKKARGGQYPSDCHSLVWSTGLLARKQAEFRK